MNSFNKTLISSVLICLATTANCQTPISTEIAKEVEALLKELAPQQSLWRHRESLFAPLTPENKAQQELARKELKKACEIGSKIRELLKVGTSVFDYPSLLAHGDIKYTIIKSDGRNPFDLLAAGIKPLDVYGYSLHMMELSVDVFTPKYGYKVLFDSKGIITEIKEVEPRK